MAEVLVGWCPECRCVYDPWLMPGQKCACNDCQFTILKRRMWKCEECGGYYMSKPALLAHEHYDYE